MTKIDVTNIVFKIVNKKHTNRMSLAQVARHPCNFDELELKKILLLYNAPSII